MSRASSLLPGHQPPGLDDPFNEAAMGDKRTMRRVGGFALLLAGAMAVLGYAWWAAHAPSDMGSGSGRAPFVTR